MPTRAEKKQESREKILKAASHRLRNDGLAGPAIAAVMSDAGLTHGAFKAHFRNKDELTREAFLYSLESSQPHWLESRETTWPQRLARMASEYLRISHRDDKSSGCAIAALASEISQASDEDFRTQYSDAVLQTILEIAELKDPSDNPERYDQAIVFLALCTGGLNLARNVTNRQESDYIMRVCRNAAMGIARS